MSDSNSLKISLTKNIPTPNIYVKMLPDFKDWIYLEDEALKFKGIWLSKFRNPELPLDLEIGCGNGNFFNHQVRAYPHRNLLGIEIKYKPLVQTIRRIKKDDLRNGLALRFNARVIGEIFDAAELNNVYVYFPDPWPRRSQRKNRLLTSGFFETLYKIQKSESFVDFKTDSEDYFDFVQKEIAGSPYSIVRYTRDLHQSEWMSENFVTSFEKIFVSKSLPIYYCRLFKKSLTSNQP
jgi:tRNA (guanine-N7-)-methyltransferase